MHVAMPSHASWVYARGSAAAPRTPRDGSRCNWCRRTRRRAVCRSTVGADHTQAIWFEIYTGRGRAAGVYTGAIAIAADGVRQTVPIELELFDFDIPDRNSMHAMLYYESSQPERYHGRNLDPAYHRLAHRHRVELVHAYDESSLSRVRGRFTGEDFTRAHGYDGPGEGVGNILAPRTFYGPGPFEDKDTAWRESDAWMTFLRATVPDAITFLYLPDEPTPPAYPRILRIAEIMRSNPGVGRALPLLGHQPLRQGTRGCSGHLGFGPEGLRARGRGPRARAGAQVLVLQRRPARRRRDRHRQPGDGSARLDLGGFQARCGGLLLLARGALATQRAETRRRSQPERVGREHHVRQPRPAGQADSTTRATSTATACSSIPERSGCTPRRTAACLDPVSTVQLANFRRGLQDHQYLTLARELGLTREVDEALTAIVPRVFSDAGATVSFPETGDPYEAARLRLARAIVAARQEPPLTRCRWISAPPRGLDCRDIDLLHRHHRVEGALRLQPPRLPWRR